MICCADSWTDDPDKSNTGAEGGGDSGHSSDNVETLPVHEKPPRKIKHSKVMFDLN